MVISHQLIKLIKFITLELQGLKVLMTILSHLTFQHQLIAGGEDRTPLPPTFDRQTSADYIIRKQGVKTGRPYHPHLTDKHQLEAAIISTSPLPVPHRSTGKQILLLIPK